MYASTERDHPQYKPSLVKKRVYHTRSSIIGSQIITDDIIYSSWLVVNEEEGYVVVKNLEYPNGRRIIFGKVKLCQ